MIFIQNPNLSLSNLGNVINSGFISHTHNSEIDQLLSRGGIESMMPTVALIILALSLGGLLLEANLISTVMSAVTKTINSTGILILETLLTCIGVNIFIGEQFLSVILPANAFKDVYQQKKLDPVVLGRVLEDGGTVINYLIPWGWLEVLLQSLLAFPRLLTYHSLFLVFFHLFSHS